MEWATQYQNCTTPQSSRLAPTPITITDPSQAMWAANGTFTFIPAPGYVGPVSAIAYVVRGSGGQTNLSELTIVLPRGSRIAFRRTCLARYI